MMGRVVINATLHEKPGHAPMRRMVTVPVAQVPGINAVLLRLGAEFAILQEAILEAPDPKYVRELEGRDVEQGMKLYQANNRIHELERELRLRGVQLGVAIAELAEERRWREKSVFAKLWSVLTGKTTRTRLTEGGESEQSGPQQ